MQKINQWHQYETAVAVADAVSQQILTLAEQAIENQGHFKIVLAGGSTPKQIYQQLANAKADWSHWMIYYGDERCLAADDQDRNSVMVNDVWLSKVSIPAANIFTMATELGTQQATEQYRQVIAAVDKFDLVLLGMGEDGHTASLFPGQQHHLDETVHEVHNAPKPPADRISLSRHTLENTDKLFFIVTGQSKQQAVQQWQQGVELPVAKIAPVSGVDIYIDNVALNA